MLTSRCHPSSTLVLPRFTTCFGLVACFVAVCLSNTQLGLADELGFKSLIDPELSGWSQKGNWKYEDGAIVRQAGGGGIVYKQSKVPDDFELRFEWKVAAGSNSGIYYRPGQYEYQILDNEKHRDGKSPRTSAGSLYFCVAPSHDVTKKPGEWNTGRVVCQGTIIQHWMNGQKILDIDYSLPRWEADVERLRLRGGRLADRGAYLSLQDHGDPVAYRKIELRQLKANEDIGHDQFEPQPLSDEAKDAESKKLAGIVKSRQKREAGKAKQPNILFILADDQSPFDLKLYNPDSSLDTPAIDQLAREGVVFDGAYHMGAWSGAVCTPSRHMIMSGRSVWHIPNRGRSKQNPNASDPSLVPPLLQHKTMPAVFNRAGYATMRTCKRGNSYDAANKLFQVVKEASKRGGTDETGSAWHSQRVLEYLKDRESNADTKPFLIFMGFSHPHDTRDGKSELNEKYGAVNHKDRNSLPPANPKQPALPVNYLPEHPFPHGHPNLRDEVAVSGVWKNRDERTIRNELGREFACSENIDQQIAKVIKRLKELGEYENTYIFYTADHGIAIGRHGLQGKQNLYEHTWRVPLIVAGPKVARGTRATGNVYLMDTLATMCDLTGITAPPTNEGVSFKPVLMGEKDVVRDTLYGVYSGGTKPGMRSVKRGDWKLIKYDVLDGTVRKTQLFNLKDNPHEFLEEHHAVEISEMIGVEPRDDQRNLFDDPRYQKQLDEMEGLLLEQMKLHDDPYRLWNQPQ